MSSTLEVQSLPAFQVSCASLKPETIWHVAPAAIIVAIGRADLRPLTGSGIAGIAAWLGLAAFLAISAGFVHHVVRTAG